MLDGFSITYNIQGQSLKVRSILKMVFFNKSNWKDAYYTEKFTLELSKY